MGIDVEIYFESKDGLEPTDLWLPEGYTLHKAQDYQLSSGATHTISTLDRYYGEHYERGSWPTICGVLMSLFASTNVGKVWYFGDGCYVEDVHPIKMDDVLKISHHYMLNGERPYRQGLARISQEAQPQQKD